MKNLKHQNKITIFVCLFITLLIFYAYYPVKNAVFIDFDDNQYVTDNLIVQKGLTVEGIIWAFKSIYAANWHPLTWISHMLDCELYGLSPAGHHWTNVQFHILNSILLFFFLFKYTGKLWQSTLVAVLFAVHPMHVESVAWVAERKDVLSTFFGMLMLLAYGRYVKNPGLFNYSLVFLFFILGLMSKPMLVTFPIILLLLDIWPFKRIDLRRIASFNPDRLLGFIKSWGNFFLEKIPLFIVIIASCIITMFAQSKGGAVFDLERLRFGARISNAVVSYVTYLAKLIWPFNLCVYYPHPINSIPAWQIIFSSLILLIITIVSIRLANRWPFFFVGWSWFIVTLIPVIGLVQVGRQAMADRYAYIPSIGFFILCVWGVTLIVNNVTWRKYLFISIAVFIVSAYSLLTYIQVGYWQNGVTLWKHVVAVLDSDKIGPYISSDLYCHLGVEYNELGDSENAISNYEKSLWYNPENFESMNNLANLLSSKGKYDEALQYFQRVLAIKPDDEHHHNNVGLVYYRMGNFPKAMFHYKKSLEINAGYIDANFNIANLYFKMGNLFEAARKYKKNTRNKSGLY